MNRFGTFIIFIGILLLMLYVLSDVAQVPTMSFLFFGLLLSVMGFGLKRKYRPENTSDSRFQLIRKLSRKSKPPNNKDG